MFKNKILLITGGTGSFGNAVLKRFISSEFSEIRIFSRDELKQEAVENQGNITCPYCKESAYIFSTSCTFQNEIFNFYMTDIYLKKFNRWAEEYKKSLT